MADRDYSDEEIPERITKRFLPGELPDHWVLLPKRLLQWAAVNIMLLGAAIGSLLTATVATWVPIGQSLSWGFPVLIGLAYLIRKFLLTPIEDEAIAQARSALDQPDFDA